MTVHQEIRNILNSVIEVGGVSQFSIDLVETIQVECDSGLQQPHLIPKFGRVIIKATCYKLDLLFEAVTFKNPNEQAFISLLRDHLRQWDDMLGTIFMDDGTPKEEGVKLGFNGKHA